MILVLRNGKSYPLDALKFGSDGWAVFKEANGDEVSIHCTMIARVTEKPQPVTIETDRIVEDVTFIFGADQYKNEAMASYHASERRDL